MPIIRTEKISNYTVMSNYHFQDKRLSLKAKGLLSLVLSLNDNWTFSIRGLIKICKEEKTAINNILKELVKYNYLKIDKCNDKSGKYYYIYSFYEQAYADYPVTDNRGLNNSTQ